MKNIPVTFNAAVAVTGALLLVLYIVWGGSFTAKRITKRKLRKKCTTIPGLANVGNTCFLNCVLQALASCPSFLKWLQSTTRDAPPVLLQSLEKIVKVLSEGTEGKIADAHSVLRALRCHGWVISAEEQDAHELFHALTSTLHDEIMQVKRQASSLLNVSWIASEQWKDLASSCDVATNTDASHRQDQSAPDTPQQSELVMKRSQPFLLPLQKNLNKLHFSKLPSTKGFQKNCPTMSIISKVPVSSSLKEHRLSVLKTVPSTTLESPFKGHLASQLQCSICGFKNAAHWSTFESLSLSLPSNPWSLHKCSLYELLDAFVLPECVADVVCDGCSKANGSPSHTTFSKKLTIGKLPDCLCIHIQRTVWLENGCAVKRKDFVAVPEFLNMDSYTYTMSINHQQKLKGGLLGGRETTLMLPILSQNGNATVGLTDSLLSSQVKGDLNSNRNRRTNHSLYKLRAVVVHIGDVFSGHFVTYRRGATDSNSRDRWFYTSDIVVKEVPFEEVTQSNAYMVIYERLSL